MWKKTASEGERGMLSNLQGKVPFWVRWEWPRGVWSRQEKPKCNHGFVGGMTVREWGSRHKIDYFTRVLIDEWPRESKWRECAETSETDWNIVNNWRYWVDPGGRLPCYWCYSTFSHWIRADGHVSSIDGRSKANDRVEMAEDNSWMQLCCRFGAITDGPIRQMQAKKKVLIIKCRSVKVVESLGTILWLLCMYM